MLAFSNSRCVIWIHRVLCNIAIWRFQNMLFSKSFSEKQAVLCISSDVRMERGVWIRGGMLVRRRLPWRPLWLSDRVCAHSIAWWTSYQTQMHISPCVFLSSRHRHTGHTLERKVHKVRKHAVWTINNQMACRTMPSQLFLGCVAVKSALLIGGDWATSPLTYQRWVASLQL